jgi:hypothetical protein
MENLKWLVETAKCAEVYGDIPEHLERILKADKELQGILMLFAKKPGELTGISATIDTDLLLMIRNIGMKGKNSSKVLNNWLRSHEDELKKLAE